MLFVLQITGDFSGSKLIQLADDLVRGSLVCLCDRSLFDSDAYIFFLILRRYIHLILLITITHDSATLVEQFSCHLRGAMIEAKVNITLPYWT